MTSIFVPKDELFLEGFFKGFSARVLKGLSYI